MPQPDVIAIRVANQSKKEMLLASDEEKFFTEPHYNRLPGGPGAARGRRRGRPCRADHRRLALQAPRALVKEFERHEQP